MIMIFGLCLCSLFMGLMLGVKWTYVPEVRHTDKNDREPLTRIQVR